MFGLNAVAVNRKQPTIADVDFALRHALSYEAKAAKVKTMTEYEQCVLAQEHWFAIALDLESKLN